MGWSLTYDSAGVDLNHHTVFRLLVPVYDNNLPEEGTKTIQLFEVCKDFKESASVTEHVCGEVIFVDDQPEILKK